jgi:hypothetical protein
MREINGEKVQNADLLAKGSREVQFGCKAGHRGGKKRDIILARESEEGNPKDSERFEGAAGKLINDCGITPESSVSGGGCATIKKA